MTWGEVPHPGVGAEWEYRRMRGIPLALTQIPTTYVATADCVASCPLDLLAHVTPLLSHVSALHIASVISQTDP